MESNAVQSGCRLHAQLPNTAACPFGLEGMLKELRAAYERHLREWAIQEEQEQSQRREREDFDRERSVVEDLKRR